MTNYEYELTHSQIAGIQRKFEQARGPLRHRTLESHLVQQINLARFNQEVCGYSINRTDNDDPNIIFGTELTGEESFRVVQAGEPVDIRYVTENKDRQLVIATKHDVLKNHLQLSGPFIPLFENIPVPINAKKSI